MFPCNTAELGHVWTAPLPQALIWHGGDSGRLQTVSGLLVQPLFTTAGPDVVREVGPDQSHGLDTRDPRKFSPLDARPINIMPSAPPQPVTPYGVFLSLWRCRRRRCGDHPIAKPLIRQPRTPPFDIGGRDGRPRRRHRGP